MQLSIGKGTAVTSMDLVGGRDEALALGRFRRGAPLGAGPLCCMACLCVRACVLVFLCGFCVHTLWHMVGSYYKD